MVATADVVFRTVEATLPIYPATFSNPLVPVVPTAPAANQSAILFVGVLCLTVLSQNVGAYAWYKAIAWSSRLPLAVLLSVSFVSSPPKT